MKLNLWFLESTLMLLSLCDLSSAVYPMPGSYYSVLMRYNTRGKTRKVARTAPSPHRLWAYFDPPAALGALPLEAIDNNIGDHWRNRDMDEKLSPTSVNEFTKPQKNTRSDPEGSPNADKQPNKFSHFRFQPSLSTNSNFSNTKPALLNVLQTEKKSGSNLATEPLKDVDPLKYEFKKLSRTTQNAKKDGTTFKQSAVMSDGKDVQGSCGGLLKLSLTPIKSTNGNHGRFFQKTIQTIGYPRSYETGRTCSWRVEVSDECQMGMMVHQIHEGQLAQSADCSLDSLSFAFNGKQRERLCGRMSGHIDSYKWTTSGHHNLNFTFQTSPRDLAFERGKNWGFKLTLSGYCWVYSTPYLSQFVQREIKDKPQKNLDELAPKRGSIVLTTISTSNEVIMVPKATPTTQSTTTHSQKMTQVDESQSKEKIVTQLTTTETSNPTPTETLVEELSESRTIMDTTEEEMTTLGSETTSDTETSKDPVPTKVKWSSTQPTEVFGSETLELNKKANLTTSAVKTEHELNDDTLMTNEENINIETETQEENNKRLDGEDNTYSDNTEMSVTIESNEEEQTTPTVILEATTDKSEIKGLSKRHHRIHIVKR